MTKLLIATRPDDVHSIYVKLGLEKNGYCTDFWFTGDFPSQQTHTFQIERDVSKWHSKKTQFDGESHYDVVWHRRPSKPILPNILHPDDKENAKKECLTFYQSMWQVVLEKSIWINPLYSATRANSKLLQLQIAKNIGMKIPKTLISNDPENIKKYIKSNNKNLIYKTLYPAVWLDGNETRITYTSMINEDDLPGDEILKLTPGIFQEHINKKYELRVTYFGDNPIAVKINSQDHERSKMDWRIDQSGTMQLEQITLPDEINNLCKKLMKELGIVFGCFDIIVTPNNEYYFLEVNEQGQFLWIEEINPNIRMLEAFVKFIISFKQDINMKKIIPVSLQEFRGDIGKIKDRQIKTHLVPR